MSDAARDPQTVTYTTKELLNEIRTAVEAINSKLDHKADASELDKLGRKVEDQGLRITTLEASEVTAKAMTRDRRAILGAVCTLIGLAVAIIGLIVAVAR